MPFLEETITPHQLIWIVSNEKENWASDEVYTMITDAVAKCEFGNNRYLFDVLGLLSRCILSRYGQLENLVVPAQSDRSKIVTPILNNNELAALAKAFLYNGGQRRRIGQRLVYACGMSLWNDLVFLSGTFDVPNDVARRFESIFGPDGVVSECTFKGKWRLYYSYDVAN